MSYPRLVSAGIGGITLEVGDGVKWVEWQWSGAWMGLSRDGGKSLDSAHYIESVKPFLPHPRRWMFATEAEFLYALFRCYPRLRPDNKIEPHKTS